MSSGIFHWQDAERARATLRIHVSLDNAFELGTNSLEAVGGELPVKRQLVSGRDLGNASAKRDNQARRDQVRMRHHVVWVSCHRASGVRGTRCNNR